jgi:hypothetical protein
VYQGHKNQFTVLDAVNKNENTKEGTKYLCSNERLYNYGEKL